MKPTTRPPRGFTLVEMAIVVAVLALLLGGGLAVLSTQIEQQRYKDTQRLLDDAREALIGHAVRFGRLPCPADPTVASGTATAGQENPAGGPCANTQGVLPWATLGLPELDAWGRRFTYRVTANFARQINPPTTPNLSAFALAENGDITVRPATAAAPLAAQIPAVLISHGPNGLGAYLPNGTQMAASSDNDEIENHDVDTEFISKTPTTTYDDLVVWVTPAILANRMIQAQRLP